MRNMLATIIVAASATVAGLAITQAPATSAGEPGRRIALTWVAEHLKPCQVEDSHNCVWRAGERGNGRGRSFVNLNGHVFYLQRER